MTDPFDFERLLAARLTAHATRASRPFDASAIAAAAAGSRRSAVRPWHARDERMSPVRVALALVLLAVALTAGTILVGAALRGPTPLPDRPAVVPASPDTSATAPTPSVTPGPSVSPSAEPSTPPIQRLAYPGVFVPTGPLDGKLAVDAYVRLADGRVLGIGDSWPERKQQALWDPTTGRFSPAGTLVGKRSQPIGVLLQDGRVLILGGDTDPVQSRATYSTAEIYDTATGTFTAAGPMVGKGWAPSAIRLADGRVLVLDGISVDDANAPNPLLATAEIYDPATERFSAVEPMSIHRGPANMALLDDGHVLVVGGTFPESGVAELFDPATGRFAPTGSLPPAGPHPSGGTYWPEVGADAIRLPDGRVLVPGRHCNETQTVMEGRYPTAAAIFDPETETFSSSTPMPHCVESATSLPDGRVFLTAFWGSTNWAGIYDPSTDSVTETAAPPAGRYMKVVGLADGGVLVVGGGVAEIFR